MKDFIPRFISSIIYVLSIFGSIYFGYKSFIILMIVFCIIIIVEYGKILRKNEQHIRSIKLNDNNTLGSKINIFIKTEFVLICFALIFGLIPLFKNDYKSNSFELYTIETTFLISSIFIYFILIYFLINKKPFFKNDNLSMIWPLISVVNSFMLIIYSVFSFDFNDYTKIILCYLFLIWGIDSIGYIVGVNLGKNKLNETLSPNKTIEGAAGSLLFSLSFSFLISFIFNINLILTIIICVLTCFFAVIGDLIQSKIKRELKIKDFGKLLPGHGGLYDRFDSVIFSFPLAYLMLKIYLINVS